MELQLEITEEASTPNLEVSGHPVEPCSDPAEGTILRGRALPCPLHCLPEVSEFDPEALEAKTRSMRGSGGACQDQRAVIGA